MLSQILLLCLAVLTQNVLTKKIDYDLPVDLLKLKNARISSYDGPLNGEMLELFGNVETLELRLSNFTLLDESFLLPLKKLENLAITDNFNVVLKQRNISSCCKNLKQLVLMMSGVPFIDFNTLSMWPLEEIYMYRENVPKKLEANFFQSTTLKKLTIGHSEIEDIDDSAFNKLEQLEFLDLHNNRIKQITKTTLTPLKNVKKLLLRQNLLEKLTTDMFPNMPNLVEIDVGYNPIKEFNLEGVKQLAPKLKLIDVAGIKGIDYSKNDGIPLIK